MKTVLRSLFHLGLPIMSLVAFTPVMKVKAQLIPDDTVGTEVTPNVEINGLESDRIDGGTVRGENLFHSFEEFNVDATRGVYFSNPQGVDNILTRVTGDNSSNIFGTLGVLGEANLFLINPNGIQFGEDATLDVGGSFFASTADSILFEDGSEFSASDTTPEPLLSISTPIGLQFRDNPGDINVATDPDNNPNGLQVDSGNTLALVGGNVTFDSGTILAPGANVEIGGLTEAGTVEISSDGSLSFPTDVTLGDVNFSNGAGVDVRSGGGGSVTINSRNLDMSEDSFIVAGIGEGLGTADSQAGDIVINATDTVTIDGTNEDTDDDTGSTGIGNEVSENGTGNAGNITVNAASVDVKGGAVVSTSTFGQGDAGNITINASDSISFDGNSGVFSEVQERAIGDGGEITIDTANLDLTNGGFLSTSTYGEGNAGNVIITASDSISFDGLSSDGSFSSGAFSRVEKGAIGNGGDVIIDTGNLSLTNGAVVDAATFGEGNAGNVKITASDSISFDGSAVYSTVEPDAIGDAGGIEITTGNLSLTNGALVDSSTFGQGDAGNIIITASDSISFDGDSGVGSVVGQDARGNGGNITIETSNLSLTNGALVDSSTFGQGDAGNIIINASDSISFDENSGVLSRVEPGAQGNGGNINITTGDFDITNNSGITVESLDNGEAGNITVEADNLTLEDKGIITSESSGDAEAGNINLNIEDVLLLRRNSEISATAGTEQGGGDGGNIDIKTSLLVAFPNENSDIKADAFDGEGGNVNIEADAIFGIEPLSREELERLGELDPKNLPTSDITAISQGNPNLSGQVTITTLDIDPGDNLVELPESVTDPREQIAQTPCKQGIGSEFAQVGRGGLPTDPNQTLSSSTVRVGLVNPVYSKANSRKKINTYKASNSTPRNIVPAQGWVFNEKGEVVLTAYDPKDINAQRTRQASAVCSGR